MNCMQLQFQSELPRDVWTADSIKGKDNTTLEVALVDSLTGQVVETGPEASAEVKIVGLQATFDDDDWTHEAFKQNIVTKREGTNDSLLCGSTTLKLSEGIGTVHVNFTQRSNWKKKCEYRLGAITEINHGTRVREAKTQPFTVKDKRMRNGKHEIPALSDEVWRLHNIAKRGAFCKRLREKNIETVQQFLTEYFLRPQNLQKILGPCMYKTMLDKTVKNALKCELDDKYFYQLGSSQQNIGIVFNTVGQLLEVFSEGHYYSIDEVSPTKKAKAHELVVSAFEHWEEVVSFNRNSVCVHSSGLSSVLPSNSPRLESPSGNGNGTYHMTEGHGILPCNCTTGNISFYNPHSPTCGVDDFEVYDMEMKNAYLGCPNQVLDCRVIVESMIADFGSELASKSWEKIKRVLAFRRKMIAKRRSEKAECSFRNA